MGMKQMSSLREGNEHNFFNWNWLSWQMMDKVFSHYSVLTLHSCFISQVKSSTISVFTIHCPYDSKSTFNTSKIWHPYLNNNRMVRASGCLIMSHVSDCEMQNLVVLTIWRPKGFQLEIIMNVSVCSFWFTWIPMLWIYGHYKYVYRYNSAGINCRRQNLRLQKWDSDV